MISFENVSFSFGNRRILAGFSMTCRPGTTTAVLGPSGCGKTTIVRLACGLLDPNEGSIVTAPGAVVRLGKVRGVLFQDDTLLPWLDSASNAWFPRPLDDCARRPKELQDLFDAFGLAGAENLLPHELSAGMKKRVELVRALCADESYLIGDEPFSVLDLQQRRSLWRRWRSEVEVRERTSLLVTHDVDEALAVSDRILMLTADAPTRIGLSVERVDGRFSDGVREKALNVILSRAPAE